MIVVGERMGMVQMLCVVQVCCFWPTRIFLGGGGGGGKEASCQVADDSSVTKAHRRETGEMWDINWAARE